MNLTEKLKGIQSELIAPKNQYNSFGKYSYRSCEDILEGVKPCLNKYNAALTITDDIVMIGDRYYVKATALLWDTETGDRVASTAYAREEESKKGMDASQVTGSTSSYARKYALNGLFCIDDVKDADTRDNSNNGKSDKRQTANKQETKPVSANNTENPKSRPVVSMEKANALTELCMKDGVPLGSVLQMYKVSKVIDLTETKFQNIMEHWEDVKRAILEV